jgi:hypothetical protein
MITIKNVKQIAVLADHGEKKLYNLMHSEYFDMSVTLNDHEYALISTTWSINSFGIFEYLRGYNGRIALCLENNQDEEGAKRAGIPYIMCPLISYINLSLFNLDDTQEKKYDVILNSRALPFKRRHLALGMDLSKLVVLCHYATMGGVAPDDVCFDSAFTPNKGVDGSLKSLDPCEVAKHTKMARVGLILSASEGNPRAVVEALLCGLPIVSTTVERCGRLMFLNETNSIIVPPAQGAVTKAVNEVLRRLKTGEFDQVKIAADAKQKVLNLQARMQAYVSAMFDPVFKIPF